MTRDSSVYVYDSVTTAVSGRRSMYSTSCSCLRYRAFSGQGQWLQSQSQSQWHFFDMESVTPWWHGSYFELFWALTNCRLNLIYDAWLVCLCLWLCDDCCVRQKIQVFHLLLLFAIQGVLRTGPVIAVTVAVTFFLIWSHMVTWFVFWIEHSLTADWI